MTDINYEHPYSNKPTTHSEALLKMYTDMANGEDQKKALEEYHEWKDGKAQENKGKVVLY